MAAHHTQAFGLNGKRRLCRLLLRDHHHRTQVDNPSTVGHKKQITVTSMLLEKKPQINIFLAQLQAFSCTSKSAVPVSPPFTLLSDDYNLRDLLFIFPLHDDAQMAAVTRQPLSHLPVRSRTSYPPGCVFTN